MSSIAAPDRRISRLARSQRRAALKSIAGALVASVVVAVNVYATACLLGQPAWGGSVFIVMFIPICGTFGLAAAMGAINETIKLCALNPALSPLLFWRIPSDLMIMRNFARFFHDALAHPSLDNDDSSKVAICSVLTALREIRNELSSSGINSETSEVWFSVLRTLRDDAVDIYERAMLLADYRTVMKSDNPQKYEEAVQTVRTSIQLIGVKATRISADIKASQIALLPRPDATTVDRIMRSV